jgi:hypothetical protein
MTIEALGDLAERGRPRRSRGNAAIDAEID